MRRLRLEAICFTESDSIQELRLTDLLLANHLENLDGEAPYVLEEAFNPPKTSFQGDRRFVPKYSHMMSAPEILPPINILKNPRRYYNQQVDIWLLGCLMFNMVTGVPPFFNDAKNSDSEIYAKIRAGGWREKMPDYHENPSPNLISILNCCFEVDPEQRISSTDIITHPYF